MDWESLNLNEKSELMKLYLKNGITSLSAIKDHYNNFATGGHLYQDGGPDDDKTFVSSQASETGWMPEVQITADRPEWQKGLTNYDWDRARQYYSNPDGTINSRGMMFLKDVASKNRTGTSNYMRDVNKLSYIPNAAVGAMGVIPAAAGVIASLPVAAPHVASVLQKVPMATSRFLLGAAGMKGTNQIIKENTDYNSWGDMVNQVLYGPNANQINAEILEFSNPGSLLGGIFSRSNSIKEPVRYIKVKEPYLHSLTRLQNKNKDVVDRYITVNTSNHTHLIDNYTGKSIDFRPVEDAVPINDWLKALGRKETNYKITDRVYNKSGNTDEKRNIIKAIKSYRDFKNTDFNSSTFEPLKSAFTTQEKAYPLMFDKNVSSLEDIRLHTNPFNYWYNGPMKRSFNPFEWELSDDAAAFASGNDVYINPSMFFKSSPRYLKAIVAHEYTHPFQNLYSKFGRLSVPVGKYYGANPDNPAYIHGLSDFYHAPTEWKMSPDEFQAEANFLKSYLDIPLTTSFKDLPNDYKEGFIPTAINIPYYHLERNYYHYLNPIDIYYLYCNYGDKSQELSKFLIDKNYNTISIIGGYDAYQKYVK